MTLLQLITKGLELISLPLDVSEVNPILEEVFEVSEEFVKPLYSLISLILSESLHSRVHRGAGVIEDYVELLQ